MSLICTKLPEFGRYMADCTYVGKLPNARTTSAQGTRFVESTQYYVDEENKSLAILNALGAVVLTATDTFSQTYNHFQDLVYNVVHLKFSKSLRTVEEAICDVVTNIGFVIYGLALTILGIFDLSKLELLKPTSSSNQECRISELENALSERNREISNKKAELKEVREELKAALATIEAHGE